MTDRKCKQIFVLLSEFLDGELPAKNCRALERHLKDCKPCIAYLETLRVTVEACREYGAHELPRASTKVHSVLTELMESIKSTGPKLKPRRSRRQP